MTDSRCHTYSLTSLFLVTTRRKVMQHPDPHSVLMLTSSCLAFLSSQLTMFLVYCEKVRSTMAQMPQSFYSTELGVDSFTHKPRMYMPRNQTKEEDMRMNRRSLGCNLDILSRLKMPGFWWFQYHPRREELTRETIHPKGAWLAEKSKESVATSAAAVNEKLPRVTRKQW